MQKRASFMQINFVRRLKNCLTALSVLIRIQYKQKKSYNFEGDFLMSKPAKTEYDPYFKQYIKLVPSGDIIDILNRQLGIFLDLGSDIGEKMSAFRYEEGKWSIKEVIGHIIDTERIFAYRGLCFARNEKIKLPGYDQDKYVQNAYFDRRTLKSLISEFKHLRRSNIDLFESFGKDVMLRNGIANKLEFSVRTIPYIMVGHAAHHIDVLKGKYLA
jgi:hypothetical protein